MARRITFTSQGAVSSPSFSPTPSTPSSGGGSAGGGSGIVQTSVPVGSNAKVEGTGIGGTDFRYSPGAEAIRQATALQIQQQLASQAASGQAPGLAGVTQKELVEQQVVEQRQASPEFQQSTQEQKQAILKAPTTLEEKQQGTAKVAQMAQAQQVEQFAQSPIGQSFAEQTQQAFTAKKKAVEMPAQIQPTNNIPEDRVSINTPEGTLNIFPTSAIGRLFSGGTTTPQERSKLSTGEIFDTTPKTVQQRLQEQANPPELQTPSYDILAGQVTLTGIPSASATPLQQPQVKITPIIPIPKITKQTTTPTNTDSSFANILTTVDTTAQQAQQNQQSQKLGISQPLNIRATTPEILSEQFKGSPNLQEAITGITLPVSSNILGEKTVGQILQQTPLQLTEQKIKDFFNNIVQGGKKLFGTDVIYNPPQQKSILTQAGKPSLNLQPVGINQTFEQQKLAQNIQERQDVVSGKLPQPLALTTIGVLSKKPAQLVLDVIEGVLFRKIAPSTGTGAQVLTAGAGLGAGYNLGQTENLPFEERYKKAGETITDLLALSIGSKIGSNTPPPILTDENIPPPGSPPPDNAAKKVNVADSMFVKSTQEFKEQAPYLSKNIEAELNKNFDKISNLEKLQTLNRLGKYPIIDNEGNVIGYQNTPEPIEKNGDTLSQQKPQDKSKTTSQQQQGTNQETILEQLQKQTEAKAKTTTEKETTSQTSSMDKTKSKFLPKFMSDILGKPTEPIDIVDTSSSVKSSNGIKTGDQTSVFNKDSSLQKELNKQSERFKTNQKDLQKQNERELQKQNQEQRLKEETSQEGISSLVGAGLSGIKDYSFLFGGGSSGRGTFARSFKVQKRSYFPSVEAAIFGLRGRRPSGVNLSGFELRPLSAARKSGGIAMQLALGQKIKRGALNKMVATFGQKTINQGSKRFESLSGFKKQSPKQIKILEERDVGYKQITRGALSNIVTGQNRKEGFRVLKKIILRPEKIKDYSVRIKKEKKYFKKNKKKVSFF